ncbi:MAG: 5-(carboxyamino)imidazole ribonucleotide mutase [Terriglobales bacterium]
MSANHNPASAQPWVGILMGSDTDLPVMRQAAKLLADFGIPYEIEICSAHRSPRRTAEYASGAAQRGLRVIIVGAGAAAALGGAVAAETTLPVIGVPLATSPLSGFDSLLSLAMMPAGVPVATMAVGEAGARNAAVLAAQILALAEPRLAERMRGYKQQLADGVEAKSKKLREAGA